MGLSIIFLAPPHPHWPRCRPWPRRPFLRAPKLNNAAQRRLWENWRDELGRRFGMLRFLPGWTNAVMWSHYSDRHKGTCRRPQPSKRVTLSLSCSSKAPIGAMRNSIASAQDWKTATRRTMSPSCHSMRIWFYEVIVGPLRSVTKAQLAPLVQDMNSSRLADQGSACVQVLPGYASALRVKVAPNKGRPP